MPSYHVHDRGVTKARELITSHQYVLDSAWGDAQPSADDEDAELDRHGWEGFGAWHLAVDDDASPETKQRYGFVHGDFTRVHRSALVACKQRAAQNDHHGVEQAADELLALLDEVHAD